MKFLFMLAMQYDVDALRIIANKHNKHYYFTSVNVSHVCFFLTSLDTQSIN